jgi:mutator protein MutT
MTTAAGVVFLARDTGRCLLQLRKADKRFRNTWGFWGGTLEPGEVVYDAIRRELQEEIGFVPEVTKLNPIDVYQSADQKFFYYSFVYVVEHEFIPVLNAESAGYAWVDIGWWPQPLHSGAKTTLTQNQGTEKLRTILKIHSE